MEPELEIDRAVNKKHLCAIDYLGPRNLPFLSQTFPNIEILSSEESWSSVFLCQQIWNHWKHLKGIEARLYAGPYPEARDQHADSNLCGIFPEEVAELRGKDDEFLKTVNIVPVMPSIACFNDLRTFKLTYEQLSAGEAESRKDLLCSKVTGLLVFARCPNLSVTIYNKFPHKDGVQVLDHMKPYASVILLDVMAEMFDCDVD